MSNQDPSRGGRSGAVYTMTNAVGGNSVLAFRRAPEGTLTAVGAFPTGGHGTGAALGSQGAVVLSQGGGFLLVVNPGSDQVTAFAVGPHGPVLLNTVDSGGRFPVSVSACDGFAYVLNAGGTPGIAGFTLGPAGLAPLPGSGRSLSPGAVGPAEVRFSPKCDLLVVTEKFSNTIDTYTVDANGIASAPMVHPSQGVEPFGFAFDGDSRLVVSESGSRAVTLYGIAPDGDLQPLTPLVPVEQVAPCWVATTPDRRFAYVANAGSGSITGLRRQDDTLKLLDLDGVTAIIGGAPVDLAVAGRGRFLYGLSEVGISGFRVQGDGGLRGAAFVPVPPTAAGLATH